MKNLKTKIIAIVCIICVACSLCLNRVPAVAGDTDITLDTAPEGKFTNWTFSDVGLADQSSVTGNVNWTDLTTGTSLDKTLFTGKIKFTNDQNSFGNFYIGGATSSYSDPSKYRGFIFRGFTTDTLTLGFQATDGTFFDKDGATNNQIAVFNSNTAGVSLRGNKDLRVAISVEYTSVTDGKVTMKVGVFFNEKLYDNTYYTVKDVPQEYLNRNVRWYAPSGTNAFASYKYVAPITLENAPEKEFDAWTFSTVGMKDQTITSELNWTRPEASVKSLDRTLFRGKVFFPTGTGADFGNFYIGGSANTSDSIHSGLLITGHSADALKLTFYDGTEETGTNIQIKNFYGATAGATLRGNANLEIAISVELLSEENGVGTYKFGVFFNGKLYNNEYYTVSKIPTRFMTQHIKWKYPANSPKIASVALTDITLENAPEKDFAIWTFKDMGIDDSPSISRINWESDTSLPYPALSDSLDKTIFKGKIHFDSASDSIGYLFIGVTDVSKWNGFRVYADGTTGLKMDYQVGGTNTTYAINTFNSKTAGVELRENSNLEFALSVEYLDVTNNLVDMKVGVFFNGKLYANTYYTLEDIPESNLNQGIRWHMGAAASGTKNGIASIITEDITLETAPEKNFKAWTFRDMGIDDTTVISRINWESDNSLPYPAISDSLDKTIFHGKIHFDNASDSIGYFFIGVTDTSKWNGFRVYADGTDKLKIDYQVGGTNTTYLLNTFDSKIAGTTLRGNKDLQFSLSVEYTDNTSGQVDMKVGVFFDGKLYNNRYYTLENIPESNLNQGIRWHMGAAAKGTQNGIASYPEIKVEDITLENAPEKDFSCWTFDDLDIQDQTLTANLNWGDNWKKMTLGDSLDKTIFNGFINFPADTDNFGNFYLGGASANDESKWRGFVFVANSTTDKLGFGFAGTDGNFYNVNGNTGSTGMSNLLATFDSDTAGTPLRGNSKLQVSMSVEYVSVTDTTATIKVGVFFDGKLYNNKYFTIKDAPLEYLNQNLRFYAVGQNNEIKSQHLCDKANQKTEDIYLSDAPERKFECWTFDDFGIDDQYLSVHLNWGDDWKEQTLKNSLDKTIFNGLIGFPNNTDNFGNFYLGGASKSEESKWRGFVFVANNSTDKLGFGFMGPEGMFYNKYGNTGSGSMSGLLATFDPKVAGTTLRGNSNLQVSMSVEYTKTTKTTADLKVGVFFDGKLYNGKYFTIKEVPLEYLNQNIRFYAVGPNNEIASQHLCSKANSNNIPSASKYEELTLHDFSILDRYARSIVPGTDFRAENYRDWETLDGTAVSVVANFPKNGSGRFSVGGTFWRGVYVGSTLDGRVEVCYVNVAGEMKRLAFLDAKTAGVKTLHGRDITYRLTFDIKQTSKTMCDLKLGVYINGKLYDGKYYTVRNAEVETLTRTFKVYATDAPFSVKSVVTKPDLSIYGFDNKTWKSKI